MKRIFLVPLLAMTLVSSAWAQTLPQGQQAQQQQGKARPSGNVYLRSGDPAQPSTGQAYLRSGPINLTPGATAGMQYEDEAAKRAAAQVYDPNAQKLDPAQAAAAAAAAANAPDYSAAAYNRARNVAPVNTNASSHGSIKDPFPSWFGGYTPPSLQQLRAVKAARAAEYRRRDAAAAQARTAQQQQPKRTTAFGTTTEQRARQVQ